jgi:hypothetical protein
MSYPMHTTVGNYVVSTARFREVSSSEYPTNDPTYLYETMIFTVTDIGALDVVIEGFQERTNDESAVPAQHQAGIDYARKLCKTPRYQWPAKIIPIPLNGDSYIAIVLLESMQSICVLLSGRELAACRNVDDQNELIGVKINELKQVLEGKS